VRAALRFLWLGRQSFWIDETVTWELLHRSLPALVLHGIPNHESTPPLYYALAWGWVRLFGWSETALRSFSASVGTATVPVVFLAGRTLAGAWAGLAAAGLAAASPFLIWYSQESRAYALFALLAALSLWLFARVRESGFAGRTQWAWSGVCVLALTAHYFAVFLVAAEALLLSFSVPRRQLAAALVPPGVTCLLLAPLAYAQRGQAAGLAAGTNLRTRLAETASWDTTGDLRSTAAWVVVAVVVLLAVILLLERRPSACRNGLAVLSLAALAFALPVALALTGHDFVFFRNFIGVWIALLLVLAIGLTGRRLRRLAFFALMMLIGVFLAADASVWAHPNQQRDNYRGVVAAMRASPGTIVVVYPAWDAAPLEHYDHELQPVAAPNPLTVHQIDFVGVSSDFGAWLPPAQLHLLVPHQLRPTRSIAYQHFLLHHYSSLRQLRITARRLEALATPRTRRPHIPPLGVLIQR